MANVCNKYPRELYLFDVRVNVVDILLQNAFGEVFCLILAGYTMGLPELNICLSPGVPPFTRVQRLSAGHQR